MSNINNYNYSKIDLRLSDRDYWDFFLAQERLGGGSTTGTSCTAVWFDFNEPTIYPTSGITTIASLVSWTGATSTGYTFDTIGLTGIDNGLITFNKISGDTSNQALLSALTGSTLVIPSGETRLFLNVVTGTTGDFVYPLELIQEPTSIGDYINLCGGFYQGYYKIDGSSYEVLPTRVNKAWGAEFWLKKENECASSANTLNELYPQNKGFFFYMGTRAENKFWNIFNGADTGCTSGCTAASGCSNTVSKWCTIPKESEVSILGDFNTHIPLSPPSIELELVTNEFLIYGRANPNRVGRCGTCGGNHDGLGKYTVCTYSGGGVVVTHSATKVTNTTNPFLIYGRASKAGGRCGQCGGNHDGYGTETVCSFSGFTSPKTVLDYEADDIDNAIGFRIKDDGSIGYRLIKFTGACVNHVYSSGYTIEESYSASGMVENDEWTKIDIRFVTDRYTDCELITKGKRKGKLMFYVNARLKHVVNDFDEFVARRLSEYKGKQVGVPFNISLGGGSQGLLESQTFDGLDMSDRNLPIQKNFAGTFIGSISQFKFNLCDKSYIDIYNNYTIEYPRYHPSNNTNFLVDEQGHFILDNINFGILWI